MAGAHITRTVVILRDKALSRQFPGKEMYIVNMHVL